MQSEVDHEQYEHRRTIEVDIDANRKAQTISQTPGDDGGVMALKIILARAHPINSQISKINRFCGFSILSTSVAWPETTWYNIGRSAIY